MSALALLIIIAGTTAIGAGTASADSNGPTGGTAPTSMHGRGDMMRMRKPAVFGTVTAISGTTITITAKQFAPRQKDETSTSTTAPITTTTTYTIDATNAKVMKSGVASTVSSIAVGDMIMVEGTTSGTTVTATSINDGMMKGEMMGEKDGANMGAGASNFPASNGQPLVGGKITAVSGSSITITNTAGVTYTVDASNAKFTKDGITAPTAADMKTGDNVLVQGAVTGTSVTAATVIDQGTAPARGGSDGSNTAPKKGFFGGIMNFFSRFF